MTGTPPADATSWLDELLVQLDAFDARLREGPRAVPGGEDGRAAGNDDGKTAS